MRLPRRITLDMPVAHSSPANTDDSLEPRHFGMWSRSGSNLSQQNCKGGYATTRQIRRNQSFNRSQYSLGSLTQGPDVGESVRSVKYSFARPCLTRGSRSVPMYSARKSKKCRPDWDITTPEMKAAWKEGRKELFYPYGKTYAQTLGEQD